MESKPTVIEMKDFEGYKIYTNGAVIGKSGKLLKLAIGTCGYYQVLIYNKGKYKTYLLHRLIANLFIDNPDNLPEVNHIDGDKLNNSISNLEWCSRSQNIRHGVDNHLIKAPWKNKSGALHTRSKPVMQISLDGNIINEYGSAREASRLSGVNYGTISCVLIGRGKTAGGYKWVYKSINS
jgi:hypothetical protein